MKSTIYSTLYDYCRGNRAENVKDALESNSNNIDILYNDGLFFRLAISNDSAEMLNTLLQYFEKSKSHEHINKHEYELAKFQLKNILQDAVSQFEISKETEHFLEPYCDKEDSGNNTDEDEEFLTDPFSITSDDNLSAGEIVCSPPEFDKDVSSIGNSTSLIDSF